MKNDERLEVLKLLETLSADAKIQLIKFLRGLRGNEGSSKPLVSSREVG